MFRKGLKVNLSNPLKGSQTRKLKAEVKNTFNLRPDQLAALFPSKAKWIMSKCSDKVIMYSEEKTSEPLLFHLHGGKGALLPTVYLIWRYPNICPIWRTPAAVWKPLSNGADLMLPGTLPPAGEKDLGVFKKGDVRAIALYGNPAAVAVGITAVSSKDIAENGMGGKGLLVIHIYNDHLYNLGSKIKPNEGFLKTKVVPIEDGDEDAEDEDRVDGEGQNDTDATITEGGNPEGKAVDEPEGRRDSKVQDGVARAGAGDSGDEGARQQDEDVKHAEGEAKKRAMQHSGPSLTPEEVKEMKENMDSAIEDLFYRAIAALKILPIPAADLYTDHMLIRLRKNQKVEFKKSTYKKLANLIKAMEKDEVIAVKQRKDGPVITGINRGHPIVQEYEGIVATEKLKLRGDSKL
eukprot:CAMPEP_0114522162 /NCGR_PEP_ID=MMETSP0109-20121206/20597_1 /TAXON_ID=29199 /ORGANISM="Chlorarachnion reptans, Strain CCCM449" /LENGTH=405 /DNA_ID=CAMNT_0001703365 /DNA_START=150 /DNA_END=1364 /DNA_ORIENTATION=+